ncbi:MAG: DUF177 domain-containing protein, partial [Anaerolineales bacterium]|nr:DUF177 domain-containing protein [Anaerolineales bacterium]
MRYNVAQLLKEQSGHTRQYTLHEDIHQIDPEIVPLSTLDGNVQLIRTADGVFALGNLHTSLELSCARCLTPFAMPLQFSLEEEFRPTIDIHTGATLPLTADDEPATRIDAHHEIDLTEVVRQIILLTIPPSPICRSKCAGLCPSCGKNWNEGPCKCKRDEIDPRLEKLKE